MVRKKVVVIGGGTGTYSTLLGLKTLPFDISAIVSMTDSGGSNRVMRDEFGLLPTSDLRQAMVALASGKANQLLRQLFTYRYNHGTGISGMTFGNLFMAALTDILGSQSKAIKATSRLLKVNGNIIPVTDDNSHLLAKYSNGKQLLGEHQIDEVDQKQGKYQIINLEILPPAKATNQAIKALLNADLIILPPGDLYTSLICNFLVEGIPQAIIQSKATKIYFVNLMTRFGQTNRFKVSDHIQEIHRYLGTPCLDYVVINDNYDFPKELTKKYQQEEQAYPVDDDLLKKKNFQKAELIRTDLLSDLVYQKPSSDKLTRSLIRHDPEKMAQSIKLILAKL